MKFNNWTLDQLIEYLKQCKHSNLLDYRHVTRVSGEIHMRNGEYKDDVDQKSCPQEKETIFYMDL